MFSKLIQKQQTQILALMSNLMDWRVFLLIIPAMYFQQQDLSLAATLLSSLSGMLVLVIFAHLARKILQPSVDSQKMAADVNDGENDMAKALLYFSHTILFIVVLGLSVYWVRG